MNASLSQAVPAGKTTTIIDFSNRILHVGIDVHKKGLQVAVLCDGIALTNSSIAASADELISFLYKHFPGGSFQCVYECGPWGFTLCRQLWAAGTECMVVNPSDIPGRDKERRSKSDPIDARRMAKALSSGMLDGVHVPTEKEQKQRSLIRYRKKLWGDLVRAKNRLKSELKFQGIQMPQKYDKPHWSHIFLNWIESTANKDEWRKDTLLLMLEEVKLLRGITRKL